MQYCRQVAIPILASLLWVAASCLPDPEPAIDGATVLSNNTSVRIDAASSARTLFTLNAGTRVSILEKRGTWYLVRDPDLLEGWMDESTVIRDSTREEMSLALAEAASRPVQNTATATDAVNLRLAPGRDTDVVRRLRRGTALEVLDRATTPRPGSDATDVWLQVRTSEEEIGWVYAPLIEFDIPAPIRSFTEGRIYTAVFPFLAVEDPEVGLRTGYLVGERRPETEAPVAFDGIRVFVWNLAEHEYATTLRLRNLDGAYPIELSETENPPRFRVPVLASDGSRTIREFVMRGTVPSEIR